MGQYREDVERVVSLLAYILKNHDKDGLEIYFTQSLHKVNSKKSLKLLASICHQPFEGISDMRSRLYNVLKGHRNKFGMQIPPSRRLLGGRTPQPQRPLSFYILTDGKWQPNDVGGIIKDLVNTMKDTGCSKEHVAIQFIRFGNDQASIDRLDELDHGLGLNSIGMYVDSRTVFIICGLTSCSRS